ncbi:ubiquitin carboxyl-terminal hydrolase 7-like [Drosophila kikkawai]|uniref:Ubiquitin carboxyl-terminal hydrolase 7-like n=1 Tax=Drosophila kikkawai TaxID=30033 RepID=A0A6P4IFC8_DROKI|nr:ubiquitin carboxyl-terminal hydrolase 7-like [Drosophila kikkawai]
MDKITVLNNGVEVKQLSHPAGFDASVILSWKIFLRLRYDAHFYSSQQSNLTKTISLSNTTKMTTNQSNEEVDAALEIWIQNLSLADPVNPSRADATHRFFVRHVGMLEEMVQSPPFTLRTMQWSIRVIPNSMGLGVFVHCSGKHDSPNWSCNAAIEFRLLNNVPGVEYYLVKGPIYHIFNAEEDDYGYGVFISWKKLLCLAYAHRGIMLEVKVTADALQGLDN